MEQVGKYKGRPLFEAVDDEAVAFRVGDKVFVVLWDDDKPVIEEVAVGDIAGSVADTSDGLYKRR